MCEPVTLSAVAAGAMSAGGAAAAGVSLTAAQTALMVASAAAAGASAGSDYETAKFNEKVAKNQQKQLENEADNVRIAGSQESAKVLQQNQQVAARNRTQMASGGVDINTGTAGQIGEQTAGVGLLESMSVLNNSSRQALGLETEGANRVASAKQQVKGAKMKMGTTLLTSAASGASMFPAFAR